MKGQGLYAWSLRFERFIWGFTIVLVFLLFAAGPALQKLVVTSRISDPNAAALWLIGGSALVVYGFAFIWPMLGEILWDMLLGREYEQYSTFNGNIGSYRSWTRSMLIIVFTYVIVTVTALDPFAVVTDAKAAFGDFVTTTSQELPKQVAGDLADSTNTAIATAAQEAAKTGKVQAEPSAMEKAVTKVWGGVDRFVRSQIDQSMNKAKTAIDNRVAANLVVLTWVPLWAILAVFALGHTWFPIGLLTYIPGVTLPWEKLGKLKGFKPSMPQPVARARARDVIGAYAAPAEQKAKELPASSSKSPNTPNAGKGGVQEGQWREVPPEPPRRPGDRGRMY